jgi:hypothetical protein
MREVPEAIEDKKELSAQITVPAYTLDDRLIGLSNSIENLSVNVSEIVQSLDRIQFVQSSILARINDTAHHQTVTNLSPTWLTVASSTKGSIR